MSAATRLLARLSLALFFFPFFFVVTQPGNIGEGTACTGISDSFTSVRKKRTREAGVYVALPILDPRKEHREASAGLTWSFY